MRPILCFLGTGTPIGDPTEVNALGHVIATFNDNGSTISSKDSGHASDADSEVENTKTNSTEINTFHLHSETEIEQSGDDAPGPKLNSDSETDSSETDLTETSESEMDISRDQLKSETDVENFESEDVAELQNVAKIYDRDKILIGSVKTNIGHTESAAGVAALIKVLLMMKHEKIVPSLHVKKDKSNINKKLKLEEYGLDIALETVEWPLNEDKMRICCVNSFGFGGSNSHAIVMQKPDDYMLGLLQASDEEPSTKSTKVVSFSAVDKSTLKLLLEKAAEDLSTAEHELRDIAYTAAFHRDHLAARTLAFGNDLEQIKQQVEWKIKHIDKIESNATTRIVFVFCGVGTTWQGMCREMMHSEPVFCATVQDIDQYLYPLAGWRMSDKFEDDTSYDDPFLNHIAIFCTQVALTSVWNNWGIVPNVIVGQSVGEVAAAYASGALSLEDAVSVIYYRSKILAECTGGKMMVAGRYSSEKLEALCESYDNKVTVAVYNSPTSCTLSGDADIMEKIKADLETLNEDEKEDIMIRPLSVQCAYHSHHVESCMDVIEQQLNHIRGGKRVIDHISTVTGELACGDDFQTGKYWAENIRRPVKFKDAILASASDSCFNVFVEIGPRQVLRAHLSSILDGKVKGICVPSMNAKKESESVYGSLNTMYELGVDINWQSVVSDNGNLTPIPRYVFNKTKFLYIPETAQQMLKGITRNSDSHMYVRSSGSDDAEFKIQIDKDTTPFVFDHFFLNSLLVPGATYVEAALDVGQKKTDNSAYDLAVSTEFINLFTPAADKQYSLYIEVTEDEKVNGHAYVVKSESGRTLCKGSITTRKDVERQKVNIGPIRERCSTYKSKEDSYACLDRIEFNYGETLSLIEQSWSSENECLVEFVLPESVKVETKSTHLHPSIIDAMFQTFGILSTIGAEGPTLPKGLGSIVVNRPPQSRMYGYSQMVKSTPVGNHYNSLLLSLEGNVIAEIQNFYTKTLRITDAPNQSIVYDMHWNKVSFDFEDDSIESKDVAVFGSKRFIKSCESAQNTSHLVFYELNDSLPDNEAMFRMAAEKILDMSAVIFANCQHVQYLNNTDVCSSATHTFLSLALLIKILRENNYTLPVFVITEDVRAFSLIGKAASNVCGAELWGMVRSAMGETAYNDLRIVDMSLTAENVEALIQMMKEGFVNHNEYIIDDGIIYHSEMIEDPNQDVEPNQREVECDPTEILYLKSTNPEVVTNPHFQMKRHSKLDEVPNRRRLRLSSICLHDSQLYPTSTVSADAENTIWPDIDDNGFHVVCLEGIGWSEDKNKKRAGDRNKQASLGFCYPVDVSTIVSIPSKCTFDIATLPAYVPGLMTNGILLFNIAEICRNCPNVHVISDNDSNMCAELLLNMLLKNKKVTATIDCKDSLRESTYPENADTIVILTPVTNAHMEGIKAKYPDLQKLVSVEEYFPRYLQRWARHNIKDTSISILNTEQLFTQNELVEKVPKVYGWMKNLDNDMKNVLRRVQHVVERDLADQGLFSLPIPVLTLDEGNGLQTSIPLRVFRNEVFRKKGCYILVGGLTGLGWELLQVIAELGGGYIATISRRPPTEEKQVELKNIENRYGSKIIPLQADITDLTALTKSLKDLQSRIDGTKIRGIFHGGGVVCDMLLSNMTKEDAEKPLKPKILGTWNLHIATRGMPLDFFVMHSSIVSILGNPGQCNYAAGNSFQDTFAHYRRSLGLCGQSINWSTLALGMATESKEMQQNFRSQGFFYLSTDDIKACFIRAVMTNPPQVTFGIFDWARLEFHSTVKMYPHKFVTLLEKYGAKNNGFKKLDSKYHFDFKEFQKLDAAGQKKVVVDVLKKMILDTFVVEESSLNEESQFVTLGIDSMEAMSFTNSIFETMQVRIPVVTLLSDTTTVGSLADYIVENIQNEGNVDDEGDIPKEDNTRLLEFLKGSVTFMQRSLLTDFLKNPYSKNFMRQADYEVTGLKLKPKDWRVMLNHLLKMNPELRTIYKLNKEDVIYESMLLPPGEVDVDMEVVPFDSICNENTSDDRDKIFFDLTKDLPLRFKIACKRDRTRMRMYIHSVISDLSGVAMLFKDLGTYMKPYICNEDLPEKDTSIVPAEAVRSALTPRMPEMRRYWRSQLAQDVEPFTFGEDIDEPLDESNWYQITEHLPEALVEKVMDYIKKGGMSLFNFIVSVYMVLLHQKTNKDLIPLVTNVDMRGYVPQLRSFVTRCISAIPIIGDLRNVGTVGEYMKKSSDRLHQMTRMGGFPFQLAEEEMKSEDLRKHIGRHRLVMDNMTHMNQTFKHRRVTVKLSNVFHTRYVYETTLYVMYDLPHKKVGLEYGYNTQCVSHEEGMCVPGELAQLMAAFIDLQDTSVEDILAGTVDLPCIVTTYGPVDRKMSGGNTLTTNKRDSVISAEIEAPIIEKVRRSFSEQGSGFEPGLSILKQGTFLLFLHGEPFSVCLFLIFVIANDL